MTFFSHCHFKISRKSGGQAVGDQLGYLDLSESPGQPEKSMTVLTPSFSASRIVFLLVAAWSCASFLLGCRGLPWLLKALMVIPSSSSFCLNSLSLALWCSHSIFRCGSPG